MKRNLPSSAKGSNLIGWLEKTRTALPLRTVDYRFSIIDDQADVHVAQVFEQNHSQPLNITYTFPLPAKASVYSCTISLDGKILEAKIEERQKAIKIVKDKAAKGHVTSLVEMERDNIFTLSLGNAPSGSQIIVTISYIEIIDKVKDMRLFRIPTSVGQRYIPGKPLIRGNYGAGAVDDTDQVPDASRISPPSIPQNHPDAAGLYFAGEIVDEKMDQKFLSSSSHPVQLFEGKNGICIELYAQDAVPGGDITLRWKQKIVKEQQISVRGYYDGKDTYALTTIKMPEAQKAKSTIPKDYYFLIDQSGSMAGVKWTKTIDSLIYFIKSVAPDDRVWLTFFESEYRDYAEKPIAASILIEEGFFEQMQQQETLGGTELLPALEHVIEKANHYSRQSEGHLILITDGQVGNELDIVTLFAQEGKWPLHCLGIDEDVNDSLLQELSGMSNGFCALLKPDDDFDEVLSRLLEKFQSSQLGVEAFLGLWESPDNKKINVWPGETLCFTARHEGQHVKEIAFKTMKNGESSKIESPIQWTKNPLPKLLWAKQKMNHLLRVGEASETVALSKESNLLATTTAFVAWDRNSKEIIAQDHLYQPQVLMEDLVCAPSLSAGILCSPTVKYCKIAPAAPRPACPSVSIPQSPSEAMSVPERIADLLQINDKMLSIPYRASFRMEQILQMIKSSFSLPEEEINDLWILCKFFYLSAGEASAIDEIEKVIKESIQIDSLVPFLELIEKAKIHLPAAVDPVSFKNYIESLHSKQVRGENVPKG